MFLTVTAGAAFGVLLGMVYFGGLWWTVRRMAQSSRPGKLYVLSVVVRLAIVLPGFYGALTLGDWPALGTCLMGFICVRAVLQYVLGPVVGPDDSLKKAA